MYINSLVNLPPPPFPPRLVQYKHTDLSFIHFRSQYWRLQTELGAE